MLTNRLSLFAAGLVLASVLCQFSTLSAAETITVSDLIVGLIDQADVPAAKDGSIAELNVREGETVTAGQVLATLDDREAVLHRAAAKTEMMIAEEQAASQQAVQLAQTQLAQQEQLRRQHQIALEVATLKSKNEVRVQASEKAEAVAKNELSRAVQARSQFADSVSQSEIDGLRLSHEQRMLEVRQASLERQLDALQLQSEQEVERTFQLAIQRARIELEVAIANARISAMEIELGRHQHRLAELAVDQHRVVAPWNGTVTKQFLHQGEWVKRGEPVVRLIRLDRLRAEGYAGADLVPHLQSASTVKLNVDLGDGRATQREGEVVFVSSELDPVNQERAFWVEFENPDRIVLPGMRLSLTITP